MHLSEVQATTSSMIVSLSRSPDEPLRGWFAPGNPCVAGFVPTFGVDGIAPELGHASTWHRFEALRDRIEQARHDPVGGLERLQEVRAVLAPVEAELWDEADARSSGDPDDHEAWARTLWPRVDAALTRLGV
jgi:hypothetical protein